MKRAYNRTNKHVTEKNAVDTMKRIDEEVYTENIAAIAVAPTIRRAYNSHSVVRRARVILKGRGIKMDVNVTKRCDIDWTPYHPDLADQLPTALFNAFRDVDLPFRYQLVVHKSIDIQMMHDDVDKLTIRTRQIDSDFVSLQHDDSSELLECYYVHVMLIFKLASPTQGDEVWLMVKLLTNVSTNVVEHAKMNRIHLKPESLGHRYGIFPANTILDKEHIIPDFTSNGRCLFVAKYMFF